VTQTVELHSQPVIRSPFHMSDWYSCPGRTFAEMEVALFVTTVLLRFDLELYQLPATDRRPDPWWQRALCPAAALQARLQLPVVSGFHSNSCPHCFMPVAVWGLEFCWLQNFQKVDHSEPRHALVKGFGCDGYRRAGRRTWRQTRQSFCRTSSTDGWWA